MFKVCYSSQLSHLRRTFGYVERELPKVPARVSVLVLGSHLDMGHHRTVTPETAIGLVESCQSGRWSYLFESFF